jgi:hypothetical protein
LRGGFIRKNFRINPLQRGLVGKFAFYRHLSRKKVRLNRCCTKPLRGSFLAGILCPFIPCDTLLSLAGLLKLT